MSDTPTPQNPFDTMRTGLEPVADPGYLQYWEVRAGNDPQDERIARIVTGLTHVAIRGEVEWGAAEYTDREPAMQARYWYRSLGPLNPMADIEPDLIQAAQLMYNGRAERPGENLSLGFDAANALVDLALITKNQHTRQTALRLALDSTHRTMQDPAFAEKDAGFRIKTMILRSDIMHHAIRLKHTGTLEPTSMNTSTYRDFENDMVKQELRDIEAFSGLVNSGVTDENFGNLFEWYMLIARRHEAWKNETLDITSVRHSTSREDAEWTGESDINPNRLPGNHDVVVRTLQGSGHVTTNRYDLTSVRDSKARLPHPSVAVIDYEALLHERFRTIDGATQHLGRNLAQMRREHIE